MRRQMIKQYLLVISGSISLLLGMVGLVLPVLPTTPFLILAAFCYLRSSRRLYNWLTGHKVFGSFLDNYITHRAVVKRTKIIAMIFLWASLLVSILIVDQHPLRLFLMVVGLSVSFHIAALKTLNQTIKKDTLDLKEK